MRAHPEPARQPRRPPAGTAATEPAPGPDTEEPIVRVDSVEKRFPVRPRGQDGTGEGAGTMTVVDRVTFHVDPGQLVSLLGPSGCGKTTLLRMVAGLLSIDGGSILIQDSPVTGPRRECCMVFQNFALLPWRTVLENVEFPLELDNVPKAERRDAAAHYLRLVGLEGFDDHYPHELSGGMQQRVGIARALLRHPSLLLMDEPFGSLDAQTREQLQDDFVGVWEQLKTTVIFVTHSIDEALVLSDRILVFSPRPARIMQVFDAPLGNERRGNALRAHPHFGRLGLEIRQMLKTTEGPRHG